jgi:hypothetical protein
VYRDRIFIAITRTDVPWKITDDVIRANLGHRE